MGGPTPVAGAADVAAIEAEMVPNTRLRSTAAHYNTDLAGGPDGNKWGQYIFTGIMGRTWIGNYILSPIIWTGKDGA